MFFKPQAFAVSAAGAVGPEENGVRVPARAAYSHSASVGSRYGFPSFSTEPFRKRHGVVPAHARCVRRIVGIAAIVGPKPAILFHRDFGDAHPVRRGHDDLVHRHFVVIAGIARPVEDHARRPLQQLLGQRHGIDSHLKTSRLDAHHRHSDRVHRRGGRRRRNRAQNSRQNTARFHNSSLHGSNQSI